VVEDVKYYSLYHEIGSEFWDVPNTHGNNEIFPENAQWFLSGRSALQGIVKKLDGCRTVAMPSWCCESMIKPFLSAGIEVLFYPVEWNGGLTQKIRLDADALFLMDYFGYVDFSPQLEGYRGTVIRDLTHSLFSAVYSDADYYFGSLRKWCGVWTGGYAWAKEKNVMFCADEMDDLGYSALRKQAMEVKQKYIQGAGEKLHLPLFAQAEELLDTVGIIPASERDVLAAKALDVDKIKSRRRKNAQFLREAFADWLVFPKMNTTDCPMYVPVMVPDGKRDALGRFLIQNKIYCPIHWPVSVHHKLQASEAFLYQNELSLVCDQRYTENDMGRMVKTIKAFFEREA